MGLLMEAALEELFGMPHPERAREQAEEWLRGTRSIQEADPPVKKGQVLRMALQELLSKRDHQWTWRPLPRRDDMLEGEVAHRDTRAVQYIARAPTVVQLIVVLLECELPRDEVWCRGELRRLRQAWLGYSNRGVSRWDF